MANQYLEMELKAKDDNQMRLTKARFKYSMALIGMGIESYYKNQKNANDNENESIDIRSEIKIITTMIAPILIPMLETMADLDLDNI